MLTLFKKIKESICRESAYLKTSFRCKSLCRSSTPIFLELGSGRKKGHASWKTLDICLGCDFPWDLSRGIPFESYSVDVIYSSHLFEHLSFPEQKKLISECFRVLKIGGKFSICVPNVKPYLQAYIDGKCHKTKESSWYPGWPDNSCLLDQVNYIAYMGGQHKYMFDEENLMHLLEHSGFENCSIREFDELLDSKARASDSIYAEALKPTRFK